MRGLAGAIVVVLGCGTPPHAAAVVAPIVPEDPVFRERTAMLRATLARNAIHLEDDATILTCESAFTKRKCSRCDVATGMDGIDPDLVDRVALAIASYPDVLLRAARIERFALCRELRYVGEDDGPVGQAELSKRRIMISVGYFDRGNGRGVEQVIHHEFFHLFDLATLGYAMTDREWTALKPRGFEYRDPATVEPPPKGFVNTYATTNEVEDRASVYEYMMAMPELCTLAAKDPVVAAKVKLVGRRIEAVAPAFLRKHLKCASGVKPVKRKPPKRPDLRLPQHYRAHLSRPAMARALDRRTALRAGAPGSGGGSSSARRA